MDKETKRLMSQHGLTEDMLLNSEASIEIDLLGRRDFIEEKIAELGLGVQKSNVAQLTGGQKVKIIGNISSVLNLLSMCSDKFGKNFQVGVFIASASCYVMMTMIQAREYYLGKVKDEHNNE